MKKNENKKPTVAAEQPKNAQPESGTVMEESANTPRDGKGCESVTVIIIANDDMHGKITALSVKKNLIGVDADIHVVSGEHVKDTLLETLEEHLLHVGTERIVLMTDGIVILNPVNLGDIAVVKAQKLGDALNYNVGMPVLMYKSALETLISECKAADLIHVDIVDTYLKGTLPEGFTPLLVGSWTTDPWVLPLVSRNPNIQTVRNYARWKKFMHVSPDSWSEGLQKFLEERFPEA